MEEGKIREVETNRERRREKEREGKVNDLIRENKNKSMKPL